MTQKQIDLLINRFIGDPQKHKGIEPTSIKEKRDLEFCNEFFMQSKIDHNVIKPLLDDAINSKNETELDLLLMLLTHFDITANYDLTLAPLLIQPWHHFHDRIASILEFDKNEEVTKYLCLGSTYTCENLEYQSDYCEFNRKCLYALAKIGTKEAIDFIKKLSGCNNSIISAHASNILKEFDIK